MRKLLALAASLALAGSMPIAALDLHRGVGVHDWLNWSPLSEDGSYQWPPYRDVESWLTGYRPLSDWSTTDPFATIKGLGFDFVRLSVDPGPLLASAGAGRAEALDVLAAALRQINGAGLNVVLDLHAVRQVPQWSAEFILDGPDSANVMAYQDMVADVAAMAVAVGTAHVAIEPFNEPAFYPCDAPEWQQVMDGTIERIRAVSAELTIIATGACGGSVAGLNALSARAGDPAIYYSFHMYEPHSFTHQGLDGENDFLSGLPWPAEAGTAQAVVSHLEARLAGSGLDAGAASEKLAAALPRIDRYFAEGEGQAQLDERLDAVLRWAAENGVPPNRLFMGEFGANLIDAEGKRGGLEDSRSRYVEAVRTGAEQRGMAWAMWEFSNPFGFSLIQPSGPAVPDQGLVRALGLP